MSYLQVTIERNLAHDTLHQRRLTLTVLTHKGHLLTAFDGQVDVREDGMGTIVLADILADNGVVATTQTRWELQVQCRVVDLIDLDGHNLFQLLHLLLHLYSLGGLIAEALNKLAHLLYFLLLILVGSELLFTTLLTQYDILVVFHLIVNDLTTRNLQRAIGNIIDEGTVVTDQYHSLCRLRQPLLQPLYRLDVQMVGGLVEQQHIRLLQQNLRQLDTHAPTTRELASGTFQIRTFKAQTHQGTLQLCLAVLCTHHHIALMLQRKLLDQCQITLALVVGTLSQLLVQRIHLGFQLRHIRKGLLSLLTNGGIILQNHHLRQIAYRRIVGNADHATGRFLLSTEYFEQG